MIKAMIIMFVLLFGGQTPGETSNQGKVEVYYFHHERRCATCLAVEKVSKEAVRELYGERVPFRIVNLDNEKGKTTSERVGINAQALVVVKGDEKVDITNDAFLYARSKPEKLREIIREKVDSLLE